MFCGGMLICVFIVRNGGGKAKGLYNGFYNIKGRNKETGVGINCFIELCTITHKCLQVND